jgi:hypothetical protein
LCQQFLVRPLLSQAAFVEYQYAIRVLDGAQPVRNYQSGAAGQQAIKRFANEQLRLGIHAGRRFVEN